MGRGFGKGERMGERGSSRGMEQRVGQGEDGVERRRGDGGGSRWVGRDSLPDGIPFDGIRVVIGPLGAFGWLGHHNGCDGLVGRFEAVEVGRDNRQSPRTHRRGSAERGEKKGVLHLKGGQLSS